MKLGSSSMLVLRSHLPKPVMRSSLVCKSGVGGLIVRNFNSVNGSPSNPGRCCLKSTGGPSFIHVRTAMTTPSGKSNGMASIVIPTSNVRFVESDLLVMVSSGILGPPSRWMLLGAVARLRATRVVVTCRRDRSRSGVRSWTGLRSKSTTGATLLAESWCGSERTTAMRASVAVPAGRQLCGAGRVQRSPR